MKSYKVNSVEMYLKEEELIGRRMDNDMALALQIDEMNHISNAFLNSIKYNVAISLSLSLEII